MNCETAPNSGVKKLVQVSEEVQKPVHVPVVLGNECFIITQQDVRKIEDVRYVSYHKLGPNGELIPADTVIGQEVALRDAIMNAARFNAQSHGDITTRQILEMLKNSGQKTPVKASIAQQMEWASSCNNSPGYPLTYTKSTSMDETPRQKNSPACSNQTCCCCHCPPKYVIHQGCNTMESDSSTDHIEGPLSARQMLKIRKTLEDTMGI